MLRPTLCAALRAAAIALAACAQPPSKANQAPEPPTFQRAQRAPGGTQLSWKNAADPDLDATVVVRYGGAADGVPSGPLPKERAPFGSGQVFSVGDAGSAFDPVAPTGCRSVTYQFFSHDLAGHWSPGVEATVSAADPPPPPPTHLGAMRAGSDIVIRWAASAGTTRLVRRVAQQPDTVIYEGGAMSATEPVPPAAAVTYLAYPCNGCGTCGSTFASATLALDLLDPDAGHELRPSALSAALSADGGSVELSWLNPGADSGFTHARLVRRLDGDADGEQIFDGPAAAAAEPLAATVAQPHLNRYTVYGCSDAGCETNGTSATFSPTLTQALRAGGYALWWRHATATTCADASNLGGCTRQGSGWSCPPDAWWKSCNVDCSSATARQLTPPQSDTETSTIRAQLQQRGVPFGAVSSSEFCRAVATAQKLDLGPAVETRPELTFFVYDEVSRCGDAYALLDQVPPKGTNAALVSHAGFTCPVLDALAPAEAAVFKATDAGALFIARVTYDGWSAVP